MKNEKELIKEAMDSISDACCYLFETKSESGKALAFMADTLLKYGTVIYHGDDVLKAACDFQAYEEELFLRKHKNRKMI